MRVRASLYHGRWCLIWQPSAEGSAKIGVWELSSGVWPPAEDPYLDPAKPRAPWTYRFWRFGPLELRRVRPRSAQSKSQARR